MSETTPLIKAALNLRVGAGFDVYLTEADKKRITPALLKDILNYQHKS